MAAAEQLDGSEIMASPHPLGQYTRTGFTGSPLSSWHYPQALNSSPHVVGGRVFDRVMGDATAVESEITYTNNNIAVGMGGLDGLAERNYSQPVGGFGIPVSSQMLQR
jgi:hypothetical protein